METTTTKARRVGLITLRTESGWVPWGVGTFMEGVRAQIENGARAFGYTPLSTKRQRATKEKRNV